MELSSIRYLSFWSVISVAFSTAGIYAMRHATIPVDFLLEYYLVLSVNSSISYAFLYRPALEQGKLKDAPSNEIFLDFFSQFLTNGSLICLAYGAYTAFSQREWNGTMWVICIIGSGVYYVRSLVKSVMLRFKYSKTIGSFSTGFAGPLWMYPYHTLCWGLIQGFFQLCFQVNTSPLYWDLQINFVILSTSIPSIILLCAVGFKKLVATSSMAAYFYRERRFVEIVCGLLANTLAQYYLRFQSLPLLLASLSVAVSWLGNIAIVQPFTDFGILQFLVTTALQFAVVLFGLHFYTFLVLLVGIAIMVLRWKMDSVSLKHFGEQERVVKDWTSLEELYSNTTDHLTQLSPGTTHT